MPSVSSSSLGGQPDHEVQLHPAPTLRVGGLDRRVQVVFGDQLVDDLAEPPAARLGGEGEPGAAHLLDLAGQPDRERVDPQRRQRQAHAAGPLLVAQHVGDDAFDAREVRAGQGGERDLVVAGAAQPVADHGPHLVGGAFPDRPGDHPGLAEPAAAGAAAEHLDVEPVVDDLDQGDELVLRVGPLGEVGDGALLDPLGDVGVAGPHRHQGRPVVLDVVEGRDVDAGQLGEVAQHVVAGGVSLAGQDGGDLPDRLLAVADDEHVDEVGQRLGVVGAVAARDHERVVVVAVLGPDGDAAQVQAVQQVRVDELGRQVERDDVERPGRAVRLEREQGQALVPEQRLEVDPGRVGAFGRRVGAFIQDLVEDLEPLVGQPDLVGIGVNEKPGNLARAILRLPRCPAPSRCNGRASRPGLAEARSSATGWSWTAPVYPRPDPTPGGPSGSGGRRRCRPGRCRRSW